MPEEIASTDVCFLNVSSKKVLQRDKLDRTFSIRRHVVCTLVDQNLAAELERMVAAQVRDGVGERQHGIGSNCFWPTGAQLEVRKFPDANPRKPEVGRICLTREKVVGVAIEIIICRIFGAIACVKRLIVM